MKNKYLFAGIIITFFLVSCRSENKHYKNMLLENITAFENVVKYLNEKYESGKTIYIIPSLHNTHHDQYVFYDSAIYKFCKTYNTNTITISTDLIHGKSETTIEFSLADNNIIYLYYCSGNNPNQYFENNRVLSTPINRFWQFNHIKKEW